MCLCRSVFIDDAKTVWDTTSLRRSSRRYSNVCVTVVWYVSSYVKQITESSTLEVLTLDDGQLFNDGRISKLSLVRKLSNMIWNLTILKCKPGLMRYTWSSLEIVMKYIGFSRSSLQYFVIIMYLCVIQVLKVKQSSLLLPKSTHSRWTQAYHITY